MPLYGNNDQQNFDDQNEDRLNWDQAGSSQAQISAASALSPDLRALSLLLLRELPRWMTAGNYPGLFLGLRTLAPESALDFLTRVASFSYPEEEPRLVWAVGAPPNLNLSRSQISFTSSVGTAPLKSCLSLYSFLREHSPCAYLESSLLYFRNLAQVTQVAAVNGVFTLSGDTFLPGEFFSYNGLQMSAERVALSSVTLPVTGACQIVYSSQNVSNFGFSVSIDGGPSLTLSEQDFWNDQDEAGAALGTPRFPGENNRSYNLRRAGALGAPGGTGRRGALFGLSRQLGLLTPLTWNGLSTLNSSGSAFYFNALPRQTYKLREPLYNSGSFYAAGSDNWLTDAVIFSGGRRQTNWSASGNLISFGGNSLQATADYTRVNYIENGSAQGFITSLSPTRNLTPLPPGKSFSGWAAGPLKANTAQSSVYWKTNLLTPAGQATLTLQQIASQIAQEIKGTFGQALWGPPFADEDLQSPQSFLPAGWDL